MNSKYVSALLVGVLVVLVHACGGGGGSGESDSSAGGSGGSSGDGGSSGSGGDGSGGTGGGASGSGGSEASGGSASGTGGGAGEGGGQSLTCGDDSDCEGVDGVCEPVRETCVDCLFDSDCASGYECVARLCVEVVACTNSLDCVEIGTGAVCDTARERCVQCLSAADCLTTADCINDRCRPYVACNNSLDCVEGQVCDTARGRCAPCARDADCGDNRRCVDNTCRRACQSDNTCTPMGQLCDLSGGYCAQCLGHGDCHETYHCSSGRCLPDVCEAGTGRCENSGTLEVCNAAGDGYSMVYCGAQQTCVEGAEAACEDWVCTPSAVECDAAAESVITCSDDGLSIVSETDCTEDDQICYQGICQDLECAPSTYFCLDNTQQLCASDGLSSSLIQTCLTDEYCNPNTAQCEDLLCAPDQPACNGSVATYCNPEGDGYVAGGTDCADTQEACVSGECRECNNTVLFLGDTGTAGNDSVEYALESAGMVVTRIDGGVTSYAGSPDAAEFGAVFASVGTSYTSGMGTAGQTAIVAAHAAGTGYVTNEWASYQITSGYNTYLAPLVLLQYVSGESPTTLTLTSANHPIWDGLDNPLTLTTSVQFSRNNVINGGVSIATCTGCAAYNSVVAVREGEGGRVVSLAHTGNYSSAFSEANILQMTVNAVQWAAACK